MPAEHIKQLLATDLDPTVRKIVGFINDIGIPCRQQVLQAGTFLPGIDIREGIILFDLVSMKYPGDLLHEAGHLAVLLPHERAAAQSPDNLFGGLNKAAAEMAAIAWSWAALRYLQLEPEVVFHPFGYKGGGANIIDNFSKERYFGVPLLQWMGMTKEPNRTNRPEDTIFPRMKYWLRPALMPE